MIPTDRIKQILELCDKATIGPWSWGENHSVVSVKCGEGLTWQRFNAEYNDPEDYANANFIASVDPTTIKQAFEELLFSRELIKDGIKNLKENDDMAYFESELKWRERAQAHLARFKEAGKYE